MGAAVVLVGIGGLIAASTTNLFGPDKKSVGTSQPPPAIEIAPGAGTEILPKYRVVATFGAPNGGPKLGDLGVGTPSEATERLMTNMVPYYQSSARPVLPALELIATIAKREPMASGRWSQRYSDEQIQQYLHAARDRGAILILDIQPGQSPWMDEVKHLRKWLEMPDVSLALDPEWSVPKGEVPGVSRIGGIKPADINEISNYLQQIIDAKKLPQKLLIVHEFKDFQLRNQSNIVNRPGVATVLNVDGYGSPEEKLATYNALVAPSRGKVFPMGFKLFYEEDTRNGNQLMSPGDVLNLVPQPDVVVYE